MATDAYAGQVLVGFTIGIDEETRVVYNKDGTWKYQRQVLGYDAQEFSIDAHTAHMLILARQSTYKIKPRMEHTYVKGLL